RISSSNSSMRAARAIPSPGPASSSRWPQAAELRAMDKRVPASRIASDRVSGGAHQAIAHDSAAKHVTGAALYIDDLAAPANLLHLFAGMATKAHARVTRLDLEAVRAAPGVVAVLTAADIPGRNDVSPIGAGDDPLFCEGEVVFHGQVLFAVAAESFAAARDAPKLAVVEYNELEAVLTSPRALAPRTFVRS